MQGGGENSGRRERREIGLGEEDTYNGDPLPKNMTGRSYSGVLCVALVLCMTCTLLL